MKKILVISLTLVFCFALGAYAVGVNSFPKLTIPMPGQKIPDIKYDFKADTNGLPQEAMVYKFVVSDKPDVETKKLASKYGFADEPKFNEDGMFTAKKDNKWFTYYRDSGEWSYVEDIDTSKISPDKTVPNDKDAISIAKKYLTEQTLLPDRFTNIKVTDRYSGDKLTNDYKVNSKEVYFYPMVDNTPVYGVSRIIVSVGFDGYITGVYKYYKDFQPYKKMKVISIDTAFEKVKSKKASNNIDPSAKSAKITGVKLGLWEDAGTVKEQPYLQPVWVFEGEAVTDNGEIKNFDAFVPAIE